MNTPRRSRRLAGLPPSPVEEQEEIQEDDDIQPDSSFYHSSPEQVFSFITFYVVSYIALVFYIFYASHRS